MESIVCYDYSGTPLKNLYQWDSNQKIMISGVDVASSTEVHFCHPDSSEALVLTPYADEENIVSTIPNILLQQAKPLIVYVFQDSGESGSRTVNSVRIPVYPRPKPADYIYTETEVLCYREIDERLRALEVGGVTGGYYTPEVTQPDENTLQFSFTASSQNMPVVDPVNVTLPGNSSNDSTQNANLVEPVEDDIPVVHFIVDGGMPFTKDEGDVQVLMRYISKTATIERYCTAKVQGSSSASNPNYKKRNWTIKIYKDSTYEKKEKLSFKGWPAMNKFVLKAGWVIPGHLRNVGAAKIWGQIMRSRLDYDSLPEELRNSPNQGATDGFHVRVFVNGMYWGIYDWIVAKDQLFGQDKDNAAHSILNSELNNQPTCAFATTSPTISGNWSEELLDDMTADTKTSMENWIKFVAGSTDEEFVANAEDYFDVQSVIDAICFDRIIMTVDNMCRNQIVFKYDTKWFMGKWDLDAILGLPPVAGQTWYAYNTAYQKGYVAYKDYGIINMLYDRTEKLFLERFKENYERLRKGPLSEANLVEVFGRMSDRLRSIDGLLAEENASTTGNGQFTGMPNVSNDTIQQIREMVVKRCAYMDEVVESMNGESDDSGETEVTLESISATYSGGDVPVGTAVTDLTGIVVTAHYSDGTSGTVTGYTLSGTIAEGSNTVTVNYGGKTATFVVTGVIVIDAPDGINDVVNTFSESAWVEGYCYDANGALEAASGCHLSSFIALPSEVQFVHCANTKNIWMCIYYFDANKKFLCNDRGNGLNASNSGGGTLRTIALRTDIENAVYYAVSAFAEKTQMYVDSNELIVDKVVVDNFTVSTWRGGYYDNDGVLSTATNIDMHHSDLMSIATAGGTVTATTTGDNYLRISYFDADLNYLGYDRGGGLNVDTSNYNPQEINVMTNVENAVYFAINAATADKTAVTVS